MGETGKKYITVEELKEHNKSEDLWISIQGKVYNVTLWKKEHPGGDSSLLNLGGQDVTDAFIAYHPSTAWQYLDKFFTGYYLKDFIVSDVSKDYRKLAYEFTKMGLFEKKGHGVLYSFCLGAFLFAVCVYGLLYSESVFVHLCCGGILGLLWIQSGYAGHDSGHYQTMSSPFYTNLAQIFTGNCLSGISMAWWKWTHNAHHIAVNSIDHDPDLQYMPFFVLSPKLFNSITSRFYGRKLEFDAFARFVVSYQHWTFYPVMIFARFYMFVPTFFMLLSKRKVPNRALNIVGIIVFWIWFPLLISGLPNWTERMMFVLVSFTVTSIQHITFCLNHYSADNYMGHPTGNDWFEKQTSGTLDISCPSWMDWFHGGLQFQLEHHLFPRLPRCQLRKVSPFVKELCKKHNLPYRSLSFFEANVATIKALRTAALQARDLSNPISKNLLWEAVNTYG
uniref:Delta-6 desaturase n=1 Tax=Ribes nigrum TaxID=78511 RepID=D2KBG6_RIBNI|nr:delta-6 desaturase [Ribes nigrum]